MEGIVVTNTAWPMISDEKYFMVDETCNLAIEAPDCQLVLASAPVYTPSM
jgi:hypothetical protein